MVSVLSSGAAAGAGPGADVLDEYVPAASQHESLAQAIGNICKQHDVLFLASRANAVPVCFPHMVLCRMG